MCGGQTVQLMPHLFQALDEARIPNIKNIRQFLIHRESDDRIHEVPAVTWYTTFVDNTNHYPAPPVSWAEVWGPKYKGVLGWNGDIRTNYLLDIVAVTFFGGQSVLETRDGLLEVLKKAAELGSNVVLWYDRSATFKNGLLSGAIKAGQYYQDATHEMVEIGHPVRSTFPKEGGVLDFGSWGVVVGSTKRDEGEAFIDCCCDPAVQIELTRHLGTAPVVPRRLTGLNNAEYLAVSSVNTPIVPHYDIYLKDGEWIAETWAKLIRT
jgi:putative spermidine/putrescine transport system substrate-binding protein